MALDKIKADAERLITAELLDENKQIELLQLIDRHCFRQAHAIVEEAMRHAVALNYDHLIADLELLGQRILQMASMVREPQPKI